MDNNLNHIINLIVSTAKPQKIILFGSRARRRHKMDSDYDLCVLKPRVTNRRALAMRIYRDLGGCRAAVDVIVETPQRFLKLKDNQYLIYREIDKNGKTIYERKQKPGA